MSRQGVAQIADGREDFLVGIAVPGLLLALHDPTVLAKDSLRKPYQERPAELDKPRYPGPAYRDGAEVLPLTCAFRWVTWKPFKSRSQSKENNGPAI